MTIIVALLDMVVTLIKIESFDIVFIRKFIFLTLLWKFCFFVGWIFFLLDKC